MCSRTLVAQGLNPIAFPQRSWLPANLAGMEGLLFGGIDALADGIIRIVHKDNGYGARQTFSFTCRISNLQPIARSNSLISGTKVSYRRDSMSSHPSASRKPKDMGAANTALGIEPMRPPLDQPLLQFLVHLRRIAT